MKLVRLNHIGVATLQTQFVIASGAKQSSVAWRCPGLPRRCSPRNDDCSGDDL